MRYVFAVGAAAGVAAAVLLVGQAAWGQAPHGPRGKPERLVKETRADGSLVLDESGLTHSFEQFKKMLRSTDTEQLGGGAVEVHTPRLPTISLDYQNFQRLEAGIVEFQLEAAIKLRTEGDLQFGDLPVRAGNVAAGYPGLYSLWLRKVTADDWRLIFNQESDAWGTMHDAAADLGEVRLEHGRSPTTSPTLSVAIEPAADGSSATLQFAWGDHVWSVPFRAL